MPFFYDSRDDRASDGLRNGKLMPDLPATTNDDDSPRLFRPARLEDGAVGLVI